MAVMEVQIGRYREAEAAFEETRAWTIAHAGPGHVDVADDHVQVEVVLPWLLQRFAEAAQAAIRSRGTRLLTKQ